MKKRKKNILLFIILSTLLPFYLGNKIIAQEQIDREKILKDAKNRKLLVVIEECETPKYNERIKEWVSKIWKFNDSIE